MQIVHYDVLDFAFNSILSLYVLLQCEMTQLSVL